MTEEATDKTVQEATDATVQATTDATVQETADATKDKLLDKEGNEVEGLPVSYDNIDEQGNVLYVDEDRLRRKEQPEKPLWKNHRHGLGIKDFLVTHLSARDWNWGLILALFRTLLSWSRYMRNPDSMRSKLYKRGMYFEPQDTSYSAGTIYNLTVKEGDAFPDAPVIKSTQSENAELSEAQATSKDSVETASDVPVRKPTIIPMNKVVAQDARRVTVPVDLVKKAIREAKYIGGMKECLCRAGNDCQDYPHDLACLFLNMGGKVVVDHGMATELTVDEALARVDRATELGLTCESLWVQVEQLIWGFRNDQMDAFLEICFCCPCCCVGFNLSHNATRDVKHRFSPSGWTAVVNHDKCVGCKHCLDIYCPQDAVHFRASDGKMVVDQENCVGCGFCQRSCPEGAITIKQTMPMRDSMHAYMREEGRLDIVPGPGFEDCDALGSSSATSTTCEVKEEIEEDKRE